MKIRFLYPNPDNPAFINRLTVRTNKKFVLDYHNNGIHWRMGKATSLYKGEDRPLAMASEAGNGQMIEVHAIWMPWATARDRVTIGLTYIDSKRDKQTLVFVVPKTIHRFVEQFARYGVLRKVGSIETYYQDKSDAFIWQSRPRVRAK